MSSMRNAVSRRPHKERAQPKERQRWGLLEKHKDYALRARDYNIKKAKLAALTQKARDKNQDEFAFGMLSANKPQAGKHGRGPAEANDRLSHDAIKLLKTQDAGYLRVVTERGRKEIKKVRERVVLEGEGLAVSGGGKKLVFLDEDENGQSQGMAEERIDSFSANSKAGEKPAPQSGNDDAGQNSYGTSTTTPTKSTKALAAKHDTLRDIRIAQRRRARLSVMRGKKLEALQKQQREMLAVADELDAQRARMSRTVGGVNKDGIRWKIRERKR